MDLDLGWVVPSLDHNKSNHTQTGFTLSLNDCLYHKDVMVQDKETIYAVSASFLK